MNLAEVEQLLEGYKNNEITLDMAKKKFAELPFTDIGFAMIDNHRELRVGYPEVIYCAGKTINQIRSIMEVMITRNNNVLATRATKEIYEAVKSLHPDMAYNELGRVITIRVKPITQAEGIISIVAAGTSDIPVVEEARETALILGNKVQVFTDVGVAGIHRLFARLEEIKKSKVVIVIAGMEGALASVMGGLLSQPIIAVPTSVGYGANFNGLSALLSMLNSCASGVSVVNIDNGFGAAYNASQINHL
ncbi:MAG: 1-(5-phosphoribosyl)-5-amino-4-imidazole-carboxylate carboxylase [Firmicutes bacterium HGW-Firmicutes-7]|nr:MAG: 1-(5-phosphoribosyl)-5-amino-4-imidazole-carboxylate carboxylase [Firmicutes bacterium HGW-Firmicutes-7]